MISNTELRVYAISMLRNEADLILPFLNQAAELFDHLMIADIQSTDGTNEVIKEFLTIWPHISLFSCRTQEKYQGAMMRALADQAVRDGADWIFLLDGDEFLN